MRYRPVNAPPPGHAAAGFIMFLKFVVHYESILPIEKLLYRTMGKFPRVGQIH